MDCKKIKLIQSFIDGELPPKKQESLKQHITNCIACQKWLEFLTGLSILHNLTKKFNAPPFFTERIMAHISERAPQTSIITPALQWLYPVTICVLIAVGSFLFFKFTRENTITVNFVIEVKGAQSVCLVGDFNDWNPSACKLVKHNSKWTTRLRLKPGRYQYMFVIDGSKWLPDPNSKEYIADGFGNKNSIIDTTKL